MLTQFVSLSISFFFNDTATTEIYPLSLHDALPICARRAHATRRRPAGRARPAPRRSRGPRPRGPRPRTRGARGGAGGRSRSEEHTSELQSPCNLVCRLLLEKKKTYLIF